MKTSPDKNNTAKDDGLHSALVEWGEGIKQERPASAHNENTGASGLEAPRQKTHRLLLKEQTLKAVNWIRRLSWGEKNQNIKEKHSQGISSLQSLSQVLL